MCHPMSGYVTTKLHGTSTADATIMRYFQTELFSRFIPSPYAGHVNDGDTVEFIIFRV